MQLLGITQLATEPDREQAVGLEVGPDRAIDGSRNGEIALPVGGLDHLADRLPRILERRMEVPARAGPAEAREGEAVAGVALGDVPRRIDANHEEGYAARAVAAERRQAVGDLLDIGAIFAA